LAREMASLRLTCTACGVVIGGGTGGVGVAVGTFRAEKVTQLWQ
jgi:ribosomal protein S27E